MKEAQKNFQALLKFSEEITTYQSIFQLLSWDQEINLPPSAIDVRSHQMALMAALLHKKKIGLSFKNKLKRLVNLQTGKIRAGLNPAQEACVREWRKDFLQSSKLPTSFVHSLSKVTSKAMNAWAKARKQDDFSLFEPHLKTIVEFVRKKAKILGYQDHPYDALIRLYEPGMTTSKLNTLFSRLKKELIKLLIINEKKKYPTSLLEGNYERLEQLSLGNQLLETLKLDPKYSRMDESTHPFTLGIHPHDTRITTRIQNEDFLSNLLSILHECGHAFYEMGLNLEYYGTPLCESVSLGIHESQSRWWETRIGRSKAFWRYFYPFVQKTFPQFQEVSLKDFYKAIHKVAPTLIRVESDEVTYCLHIILRFEIEKALVEGKLEVKDLPGAWNTKTQEIFGITPPNNRLGCLQDIHWSMGELGYFPTYALGNLYASHFFEAFQKEYPDWERQVESGELMFIREWLRTNIHIHGRRYLPEELALKVTGKAFSEKAFVRYLQTKYESM